MRCRKCEKNIGFLNWMIGFGMCDDCFNEMYGGMNYYNYEWYW